MLTASTLIGRSQLRSREGDNALTGQFRSWSWHLSYDCDVYFAEREQIAFVHCISVFLLISVKLTAALCNLDLSQLVYGAKTNGIVGKIGLRIIGDGYLF